MVHCPKCWTKNEEDAKYCVKCGATLEGSRSSRALDSADEWGEDIGKRAERWGESFGKRAEEECFGLPHGGSIFGLVIGIIIIVVGMALLAGIDLEIWPLIVLIFGVLIVGGAIYTLARKR
jgi:uncharacterized membrane protein YvbJ